MDEARYRRLFEDAPIGIIHVDLAGKPIDVNRRAAEILGYGTPERFLAEVPSMLDLWADRTERDRAVRLMYEEGGLRDFEFEMKRRDGSWATLSVSASPVHDAYGRVTGVQVTGLDVTGRIESERRLDEAQAHASIGFWTWWLESDRFEATKEVFRMAGLDPSAGDGTFEPLLQLVHPEDRDLLAMRMSTFRRAPGERFEIGFRIATPRGEIRRMLVRASVEADGRRVSGSTQDVTSQKEAEDELVAINEMKTEFLSVVAHDLRLPLSVAAGYSEFLEERWDEIKEAERRTLVGRVRGSLDRLARLMGDVLEVTRIESGALRVEARPFDVERVIRSVTDEVGAIDPFPSVTLDIEDGVPTALGDREATWRVMSNLLSNAVKYAPEGRPIEVCVGRAGSMVQVAVRDHGPGISRADRNKLFQRFSRLPAERGTRRPPGTGLGLYICRSLVEAWGGTIWVDSEPGHGSTFTFTIPAGSEAHAA